MTRAPGLGRLLACIAVLAGAEVVLALGHVLAAQILDGVMLILLVGAGHGRAERDANTAPGADVAAMRALALVALIRVVGPGLPLGDSSAAAGEALVALLVALAAFKAAPAVGVSRRALTSLPGAPLLAAAAVGGLALGFAAYQLGAPALASRDDALGHACLLAAAVAAAAVAEELVFRGLVQVSLQRVAGSAGALLATGLFAYTYLSAGGAALVVLVALAGLLFADSVARSGAVGGAVVGHVLFACGAVVLWPAVLGPAPATPPESATLLLAAGAVAAAVLLARGSVVAVAGTPAAEPDPAPRPPAQVPMRKTSPSRPR